MKRNAKELRASAERYRALFDNANDGIVVRDLEGSIIMANQALAELTGYTVDELTKMNIAQLLPASSFEAAMERQKKWPEHKDKAMSQRYELQMIRKDGTERTIEVVTSLVTSEEQPPIIQGIVRDITEQRRAQENLRTYASQVTKAQEEERKRIARELHDETAQALARLGLDIDSLLHAREQLSGEMARFLIELRNRTDEILEGVRRFSQDLRPSMLDELGLMEALQWLTDDMRDNQGINTSLEVQGTPRRLSPEVEVTLFRIVQEALSNVRKHAQATEVKVRAEISSDKVKLGMSDNGQGFELPEVTTDLAHSGKLGVIGMQERARLLGGTLTIQSELGKGTTVVVEVEV